jgi:hypothetical protein
MKRNNNKELIEKFWKGETTLSEEELLFADDKSEGLEENDRAYFRFIENARNVEYSGEAEIWQSIVAHDRRKRRIIYLSSGVAASILLILSLFIMTLTDSKDKNFDNQIASNNIKDYYDAFRIDNGSNSTLYINGCKSSTSDYHTVLQNINPKCIKHIKLTKEGEETGKPENKKGKVEVWLEGIQDDIFSVCEGTLYFYQDGEIKSIAIDDECGPNLLVDCSEKPLSEIVNLKPQQIKSIVLTTDPRNCKGVLDGEFIVMETK